MVLYRGINSADVLKNKKENGQGRQEKGSAEGTLEIPFRSSSRTFTKDACARGIGQVNGQVQLNPFFGSTLRAIIREKGTGSLSLRPQTLIEKKLCSYGGT